jgi:TM2 domain-containing membrane protein YozV
MQPYGHEPLPVPYRLNPGYQQQAAAIAVLGKKSSGLAAVLSLLLVGAGQMYCGRVGRGLAFLAAYFVSALLMFVLIGFLLAPIVLIWALVDAINLANRHNAELLHRLTFGQRFH